MSTTTKLRALPASGLLGVVVGSRIWFDEEKRPYRIRARNERFIVCTKPHNPLHTVIYTVVDLAESVRGTENLVFGFGAETDEQCNEMLARLGKETDVSRRNRITLRVARMSPSNAPHEPCGAKNDNRESANQ